MIDLLLQDGLRPFLAASGIVAGLLVLEMLLLTVGISTEIGGEADADLGPDFAGDLDVAALPDLGHGSMPLADQDGEAQSAVQSGGFHGGLLDLLGLRGISLTVWLAFLAASFAVVGFAGQAAVSAVTGSMLPGWTAGLLAALPALLLTSRSARLLARMLPRETTAAVSERAFGRRFGNVTVGVARAGHPAQVRVTDQHGNLQYLMAEPLDPEAEFRQGARVLVLRATDGHYRLVGAE